MAFIQLSYLAAAVLFILALKRLGSPKTARRGNLLAAVGMFVAVIATLLARSESGEPLVAAKSLWLILAGVVVGSGIGAVMARKVQMTAMPQMVALFNGFGGGASALVAAATYAQLPREAEPELALGLSIQLGAVVGSITLSGSVVAFAKLQELMTGRPITYPFQRLANFALFLAVIGGIAFLSGAAPRGDVFSLLLIASLVFGVLFVIPIGGADMPVVISLLNSFSGVAAAITGFVISNSALVICGALVGASGLILTQIMCRAMNRSLGNVLFSAFGSGATGGAVDGDRDRTVRDVQADDVALLIGYARLVVFVPGYGLAVAQAQRQVRELATLLEERDVEVKYAIHPVAGRMPGHMNVLLAEADVPYEQLYDMDSINSEFSSADVVIVVGANDVVNPAARDNPTSPIYGMPILNVDEAKSIVVLKRSMNPGFAGIDNELFYHPNTRMLFGDAKASLSNLAAEVKEL